MSRPQVGRAWCSPHDCHPSECFGRHNPKFAQANSGNSREEIFQEFIPPPSCPHKHEWVFDVAGVLYGYCSECNPYTMVDAQ